MLIINDCKRNDTTLCQAGAKEPYILSILSVSDNFVEELAWQIHLHQYLSQETALDFAR